MPNVMVVLPNIGVWFAPTARVPCSNAANRRAQDLEDANWILHLAKFRYGATAAKNVYIVYRAGDGQTSCKVWLASAERRRCSNEAKTRNPLKFVGVVQANETILAASGPKFNIVRTCGGNSALVAKI